MSDGKGFIGMGHNPDPNVPDIPTGFGMALMQEAEARSYFEGLSDSQKTGVINYIQNNNLTGGDAKRKIADTIENLKKKTIDFIG